MAEVEFRVDGHVAVMTINRPQARNAMNMTVVHGLVDGYAEIARNPDIRIGILTGAGGHFCAGMDLKGFAESGERIDTSGLPFGRAASPLMTKPMIAAIEGYAVAGGFELALTCDLIVASRTAKMGLPEAKRGLVAAGGGMVKMARQAPMRAAMEMVLTGDPMEAEQLHAWGVVNRLTEPGGALAEALALAERIAENSPLALRVSMQVVRGAQDWPPSQAMDLQNELTAPVFASDDPLEGAKAFAEKRKPRWTTS